MTEDAFSLVERQRLQNSQLDILNKLGMADLAEGLTFRFDESPGVWARYAAQFRQAARDPKLELRVWGNRYPDQRGAAGGDGAGAAMDAAGGAVGVDGGAAADDVAMEAAEEVDGGDAADDVAMTIPEVSQERPADVSVESFRLEDASLQDSTEVKAVLDSRGPRDSFRDHNIHQYEWLVKWAGYDAAENSWEPAECFQSTPQLWSGFHMTNPDKPRPMDSHIQGC